MKATMIKTVRGLRYYLKLAMQLEHATIPPYLTALYSMKPDTNSDAAHVIRTVVVEEMLHLTLAANMLNAIGGTPDLTAKDFVPEYPAYLPDGEDDFQVSLEKFSPDSIGNFLNIERPKPASEASSLMGGQDGPANGVLLQKRARKGCTHLLVANQNDPEMHFYSIGEFYNEILRGFESLHDRMGPALFYGDLKPQVGPKYYYSGGASVHEVHTIEDVRKAIKIISEQGEGYDEGIFGSEGELAHYYRFKEICEGRYYDVKDNTRPVPQPPSGRKLVVQWDDVYPIKKDPTYSDYKNYPDLDKPIRDFADSYRDFLSMLNEAYNGKPELLMEAVTHMFKLRNMINAIVRNPIPGHDNLHAAPIFVHYNHARS
jgi:hypothetical protein